MTALQLVGLSAILPAGATPFFLVFWHWFAFWRRHAIGAYTLMLGTFLGLGVAVWSMHEVVFAHAVDFPAGVQALGWALVALASAFGLVADRQIGLRVRSFLPFFTRHGRIELRTTGAYGVVRHPIYATGLGYQVGVFVVSGYVAIVVAGLVFLLGALWFTRQEEQRLIELLDDPSEYERYRNRVPALFPRIRRKEPPASG